MAASTSFQNTRPKLYKIKGIFQIPYKSKNDTVHGNDSDTSEEEEDFDDIYHDFSKTDNLVSSKTPREVKVVIKSEDGRTHNCTGKFPLTQMFWQVEAYVDSRGFLRRNPVYAIIRDDEIVRKTNLVTIFLSECFTNLKVEEETANEVKACFEAFCQMTGKDKILSFAKLENILTEYLKLEKSDCCFRKKFGNHELADHSGYMKSCVINSELGSIVLLAASHPNLVRTCSLLLPNTFMSFLHQLRNISMSNTEDPTKAIDLADEMARMRPWEYAFKDILATKFRIYGTEAKLQHYEQADYLAMTPQTEKDAIYIYDALKDDSKRKGNMCISLKFIKTSNLLARLKYNISTPKRWSNALGYLENNKVITCEEFNDGEQIFLRHNWQAEVDTASCFDTILKRHKNDPLIWDIDFHSSEFETIRKDPEQLRASYLICHLPITVLCGKGGCGKTTVVTKLLQHLCVKEEARLKEERADEEESFDIVFENTNLLNNTCEINGTRCEINETRCEINGTTCDINDTRCEINGNTCDINGTTCEITDNTHVIGGKVSKSEKYLETQNKCEVSDLNEQHPPVSKAEKVRRELVADLIKMLKNSRQCDCPELKDFKNQILLTAPTGKAARLLGCKAKLPSATLHSVIMSWRMYHKKKIDLDDTSWNYAEVKVLVVDECSLVSVRLFATLMNILLRDANLQKVILLGDFRQLPSIEPGELLGDVFKTLHSCGESEFGLSIELKQNHRSESALIVENAGKISNQVMPTFDLAQRFHLIEISDSRDDSERDQMIRKLLMHAPDVTSDVESQFVSFRNADCRAINELCCLHYNGHSITKFHTGKRKARYDFQIGDKICLGKNNLVINSRRHIIDKYMEEYPEFQKAYKEAQQKREKQDKSYLSATSQILSGMKLKKTTTLDDSNALNLILGDDETFNKTIEKIKEDNLTVEKKRAELEKIERKKRAEKKKAEWMEKSSRRASNESLLGESSEKLCNGEVFFIMDEFNEIDKKGKHHQYFVLSDRDPDLPRVVCVPFIQLKQNCQMKHSWARTIHTYQGSESRTVVYVLGKAIPQNWKHIYTAITRGKNSVYIVGSHDQLLIAIKRSDQKRFSKLSDRLKKVLLQNKECLEMCKQQFSTSYQPESTIEFSIDSEHWSDSILSQCLQLEEEVEAEKDIKDDTADTSLETTHCNVRDSLIYKSSTVQSFDRNKKLSTDVNTGLSSEDTQDTNEFQDDDPQLELMMAEMDNKVFNGSNDDDDDDGELSQCVLQAPKQEIGKLSNGVELISSTNQISNAPEYNNDSIDSSDSEVEYRFFESVSKSKARRSREFLSSPGSSSVPLQKSPRDLSLSPEHEASRASLNVTPPRSSLNGTPENTCITSPQKKLCVDTPFHNSFTSSMSLHEEVEDDESPLPRKTPSVCRKL